MCLKRFLALENICLDIKISKIRSLLTEIWRKIDYLYEKIKMAANNSKWPPKKCQPYFLVRLSYNLSKKYNFEKCTKKFDETT